MKQAHQADDFRAMARRRLPRFAFDFLDGGAGRETAITANRAALDAVRLVPRVLTGPVERSPAISLLGRPQALPFAVAPVGLYNLAWPGADRGAAVAAVEAGIPFILSTAGTMSIEEAARLAGEQLWFQLYVGRDAPIVDDLLDRARAASVTTLVVTVDLPAPGKRLRDLRNGFSLPFRWTPAIVADLLRHPAWALATLRAGAPTFETLSRYHDAAAANGTLAEFMARQSSPTLDWDAVARLRARWHGTLILKGILHGEDAVRAFREGIDAVIVSNHGGRQLDAAIAPAEVLPSIRRAVGDTHCLLLDGGISSGEDIVRAVALGADAVLIGRPFPAAAAARGPLRGPRELIAMLRDELDRAMVCCGCATIASIKTAGLLPPSH